MSISMIFDAVSRVYEKSKQLWNLEEWEMPIVSFTQTGSNLGRAYFEENRLDFNLLLYRRNPSHYIQEICTHETCHLISYQLHGSEIYKNYHGAQWQGIMRKLGCKPQVRYRDYHIADLRDKDFQFVYSCSNGCFENVSLGKRNHKRAATLQCTKCQTSIKFTGDVKIIDKVAPNLKK